MRKTSLAGLSLAISLLATGCAEFLTQHVGQTRSRLADESWIQDRARYYESRGQDHVQARRNANYDFVWEHGEFPK